MYPYIRPKDDIFRESVKHLIPTSVQLPQNFVEKNLPFRGVGVNLPPKNHRRFFDTSWNEMAKSPS